MYRAHEPLGTVGADGNECETDLREAGANFGEVRAVGGVAREKDGARGRLNDVAAPQSLIAIAQTASGKMPGRNRGDAD